MNITASLVLYNSNKIYFEKTILSFLNGVDDGHLFVIDNSPSPISSKLFNETRITYHHSGDNVGFGSGHNLAFDIFKFNSDFHLILNPDVEFDSDVINKMVNYFKTDLEAAVIMPKIIYPNGEFQYLCKLLPTPYFLFLRRFLPNCDYKNFINDIYECKSLPIDSIAYVPMISGCFILIKTTILKSLNGFDERYFMYMEDVDLLRRASEFGKLVFYPHVTAIHHYEKGSYKNIKLLIFHIISAIKYFNKWGWFFDVKRYQINKIFLLSLRK